MPACRAGGGERTVPAGTGCPCACYQPVPEVPAVATVLGTLLPLVEELPDRTAAWHDEYDWGRGPSGGSVCDDGTRSRGRFP